MADRIKTTTTKTYSWSKWGGGRFALVKEQLDEWFCQFCGRKQVKELPAYMIPLDDEGDEFFRACSRCKHQAVTERVESYRELLIVVKKRR